MRKIINKKGLTVFAELNGIDFQEFANNLINYNTEKLKQSENFYIVNINKIEQFLDNNWLSLVGNRELKEMIIDTFNYGIENGILGYWNNILGSKTLIRGIEMYGPDFFFIQNKYWDIIEDLNDHIKIKNKESNEELIINKTYLIKTLRKPSLYNFTIIPKVDTYMVSIPPTEISKLPTDLKKYVNWGKTSKTAKPAINKYKNYSFKIFIKRNLKK